MTNEHEQHEASMHEKLCAYILGECTSDERLEVERELLRSPELRAQRDAIERTVGLVKDALGKGETLSGAASATVLSAAAPSRPGAFRSSGFLRLAAGIGAVALGYAILRERVPAPATEVARLEPGLVDGASRPTRHDDRNVSQEEASPSSLKEMAKTRDTDFGLGQPSSAAVPAEQPRGATLVEAEHTTSSGSSTLDTRALPATKADHFTSPDEAARQAARRGGDVNYHYIDVSQEGPKNTVPAGQDVSRAAGGAPAPKSEELSLGHYLLGTSANPPAPEQVALERLTEAVTGGGSQPSPKPAETPATPASVGFSAGATGGSKAKAPGEKDAWAGRVVTGPATGAPAAGGTGPSTAGPSGPAILGQPRETLGRRDAGEAKRPEVGVLFDRAGKDSLEDKVEELYVESSDDDEQRIRYVDLPPAEQQLYLERHCRRIFEGCKRLPNERPRDMYFRFWGDNPFEVAALDPLSTFAADVDTASYALARRYLNEGHVPEKAQIRTEEFVNYFKSDVPAPTSGVFAIRTDLAPSRFSKDADRQMMRVVLRGKDLSKLERPRMNLTFVVDVSGSMREQNRLEMVKNAMRMLITQLTPYDKIGIVKFSNDASLVLPLTNVSEKVKIEQALAPLTPEGSTNSNAGLELGYGVAAGGLDKEAINRVVFLSDGVANVGETDPAKIAERVKPMREKGVYLNTIGVGMNNHNDVLLEQLADKADGMCVYVGSFEEVKKQMVDNFTGAFQPIARDVKIQVEFDPAQVLRYRLLGYENRAIADADFRNDKVDAGELGAGHQVTALYEIERQPTASSSEKPLATVRVRWKEPSRFGLEPELDQASEMSQAVSASSLTSFEGAGQSYRKAVLAAQFAEILRRSIHARGDSLDDLLNEALRLQAEIPNDTEFKEFVLLVSQSKDLILRTMPRCDELCQAIDSVREFEYRRAQLEQLQREMDQKTLADLQRQNDELEARLRDLIRRRLENQPR